MNGACGEDIVQIMRLPRGKTIQNTYGGYSKDTQIRAGDNGGYVRADRDIALAAMRAYYWRSEEAGWFEKPRRRLDWGHRWPTRRLPAV
jgi:hypothetical protein